MDSYLSALCIFYIECFNILMMTGGGGEGESVPGLRFGPVLLCF